MAFTTREMRENSTGAAFTLSKRGMILGAKPPTERIEPDVPISDIRLSDQFHLEAWRSV